MAIVKKKTKDSLDTRAVLAGRSVCPRMVYVNVEVNGV